MPRRATTIFIILLGALATAFWFWHSGSAPSPAAAPVVTSRPVDTPWGPLTVMAANIRLDEPSDGINAWANRRELLVKTLLKYQPEILACQEVSPAQGAYLHKQLAPWYSYYPRGGVGPANSAGGTSTGETRSAASQILGAFSESVASLNTIYYRSDRFDILDGEAGFVLPDQPQATPTENTFFSLAIFQERRPTNLRIKASNPGTLIVVDVHFRMDETFALRCADRIHQKIAAWLLKYPNSGILLLGDMNRDRTTRLYANLTAPAATPEATLKDLFDYTQTPAGGMGGGANNGGSFHNFTGRTNRPWPTDLIFAGGNLHVATASEILRDHNASGRYPSDHFFVRAAVSW